MTEVVFSTWATGLLALHAVLGVGALASASRLLWLLVGRSGATGAAELKRLGRAAAGLFVLTVVVGLMLYPHYRVAVRALVLDREAPWASNLFDMKENVAALALPFAVALGIVGADAARLEGGTSSTAAGDLGVRRFVVGCAAALWVATLFAAIAGLVVHAVQAV